MKTFPQIADIPPIFVILPFLNASWEKWVAPAERNWGKWASEPSALLRSLKFLPPAKSACLCKDQTIYSWEPYSKATDRFKHNGRTSMELTVYGVAAVRREERMKWGKDNTGIKTKGAILKEDSCADRMAGVRTYSFLHGRENNPCSSQLDGKELLLAAIPKHTSMFVCLLMWLPQRLSSKTAKPKNTS